MNSGRNILLELSLMVAKRPEDVRGSRGELLSYIDEDDRRSIGSLDSPYLLKMYALEKYRRELY